MTKTFRAAAAAGLFSLSLATSALAEATYKISKIAIMGNQAVSTDVLLSKISTKPGTRVPVAQVATDTQALKDAYANVPVDVNIASSLQPDKGGAYIAQFVITETKSAAPVVTKVAPKLHELIFRGNHKLSTEVLAAAAGVKPGDDLSNDKITAMQQAIVGAYKAAKKLPVSVDGENQRRDDGSYDVIWNIDEKPPAKKDQ